MASFPLCLTYDDILCLTIKDITALASDFGSRTAYNEQKSYCVVK